jgi:hypothetical protein
MRSFWSDPYLWVHLAGLAAVPIFLEVCLIGFATGDPFLPMWLELILIAAIGITPLLWMQWKRPFYIFSLLVVALKPEQLTLDQRRLLTLFRSQRNRILAIIVPIILFLLLYQIYAVAPIAAEVVPFSRSWRLLGLGLAAIGFLGCNLFSQVPVSVLGVMLTSESSFAATTPHPLEQVQQDFTRLGLPLNQLLPPLVSDDSPTLAVAEPGEPSLQADLTNPDLSSKPQIWDENVPEPNRTAPTVVEDSAPSNSSSGVSSSSTSQSPWDTESMPETTDTP